MTAPKPEGLTLEDWVVPMLETEREEPFEVEEAEPLPEKPRVVRVVPGSFICGRG